MCKVTIAIPLYNAEKYIEKAMFSALDQTFNDIEILIVNDKSTDSGIEKISHIQDRYSGKKQIRIIHHEENKGVAEARNTIIHEANGKYLFFLDSDDMISKDCIQTLFEAAEREQTDAVIASHEVLSEDGNKSISKILPNLVLKGDNALPNHVFSSIQHRMHFYIWNILFNLSFIKQNKLIFHSTRIGEDVIFFFDFMPLVKSCVLIPQVTYTYVKRTDSLSQFNVRNQIPIEEIYTQLYYRNYKKEKYRELISKPYSENMAIQITTDCFYAAVSIIKKRNIIVPSLPGAIVKDLLKCPFTISQALTFKNGKKNALLMWMLSKLPAFLIFMLFECYIKTKKH